MKSFVFIDDPQVQEDLNKLINLIMKDGRKAKAVKCVVEAFASMKTHPNYPKQKSASEVFQEGIERVCPFLEVRKVRVKGSTYQVPGALHVDRQRSLGLRWLIQGARRRKPMPFSKALGFEIVDAFRRQGYAIDQRNALHKLAESNRAYAHFRWWA
uniref:Ribosomal protein S7 n=1 Tax=Chloropicon maureeniae TaxID=1461542 RepID=A0A4D6C6N4_9CHLO|nr:ribosomal protein S7 [Chloropicon maureeniae]QBX98828.1 ribosomal protein S7 [Chloropicon maureeniae]